MHELFLTAVINNADMERADAVLQGLCAMSSWQSTHRVLFFNGPPQPRGLPTVRSLLQSPFSNPSQPQPSPQAKLWQELHQHLTRQSYVLQLRYEVVKDRDFGASNGVTHGGSNGPAGSPMSLGTTPGVLRWTDIPDPTGDRPVTQRKKLEIQDPRNLVNIMQENNHRFKSEIIEESHTYFRDNIEYTLVRYYQLPAASAPNGVPQPLQNLPPWASLTPVDSAGKWMFFIRSQVQDDNSPEKMQKAQDGLMAIREELLGVFDFKVFDRRAHDTRLVQQVSNMPAPLPQTVRA